MDIKFKRIVNIKDFYDLYLPQLFAYAHNDRDINLTLDLQDASFISPSVLCDLLSYLSFINYKKEGIAAILFGWNTPLIAFLENTDFFLMADIGKTVLTDVTFSHGDYPYSTRARFKRIKDNTDKIRRINLPSYCDYYGSSQEIIYHQKGENVDVEKDRVSQMVQRDFWSLISRKGRAIESFGIRLEDFDYLANAYSEIIINSYFHGGSNYCFYTFQNYNKSGLSFVSSDTGMGYYNSIREKILEGKRPNGLFTDNEFLDVRDEQTKSLMGIIEGLLYRHYNPKQYFDHGIMDIIKIVFGVGRNNNAIVRIQSGYAMLQMDIVSLHNLFEGMESTNLDYGTYSGMVPKEQMFKEIVLNKKSQQAWIESKHLVFYNYNFPGIHISVSIDPRKDKGSR